MALADELLEVLACPKCKGDIEYKRDDEVLICHRCRLVYRIEDDIPIMLVEEALTLDEWEERLKGE
ncbi:MAG: Trm112 family protein [Deferribacteres bacterium]|nr:Trm112 family protein [Deferribacteres bacterium]